MILMGERGNVKKDQRLKSSHFELCTPTLSIRNLIIPLATAGGLIIITIILVFLARGYQIDFFKKTVVETGLLVVRSVPDSGLILIDDTSTKTATNASLSLKPGEYRLKIQKTGFNSYEKKIKIEKELITRIDALLVPIFPELKPLTATGANNPLLSPDGTRLIFSVNLSGEEGLWSLELGERPFGLSNRPNLLLTDNSFLYSQSVLSFSPDSKEILLENVPPSSDNPKLPKNNLLFDLQSRSQKTINDTNSLKEKWGGEKTLLWEKSLEGLDPKIKAKIDVISGPSLSPDGNFILYKNISGKTTEFKILKIRETLENADQPNERTILTVTEPTIALWFPDSRHLLILEKKDGLDKASGTIFVLELDGENKTKIFEGAVLGQTIFPFPSGSKIAILIDFSSENNQSNLYSINLQ